MVHVQISTSLETHILKHIGIPVPTPLSFIPCNGFIALSIASKNLYFYEMCNYVSKSENIYKFQIEMHNA